MSVKDRYLADFSEENFFHVYNRTNNYELLFSTNEDRSLFLQKYDQYLSPFLDTWTWTLIPDHFHFLVRVKSREQIRHYLKHKSFNDLKNTERKYLFNTVNAQALIELEWQRFFTSYSMNFNNIYNRKGNLFHRPFKRMEIINETQLMQCIIYIHANALKHNLVNDFTIFPWSSWKSILSNNQTFLAYDQVLNWFGGKDQFIKMHMELSKYYYESEVAIED